MGGVSASSTNVNFAFATALSAARDLHTLAGVLYSKHDARAGEATTAVDGWEGGHRTTFDTKMTTEGTDVESIRGALVTLAGKFATEWAAAWGEQDRINFARYVQAQKEEDSWVERRRVDVDLADAGSRRQAQPHHGRRPAVGATGPGHRRIEGVERGGVAVPLDQGTGQVGHARTVELQGLGRQVHRQLAAAGTGARACVPRPAAIAPIVAGHRGRAHEERPPPRVVGHTRPAQLVGHGRQLGAEAPGRDRQTRGVRPPGAQVELVAHAPGGVDLDGREVRLEEHEVAQPGVQLAE